VGSAQADAPGDGRASPGLWGVVCAADAGLSRGGAIQRCPSGGADSPIRHEDLARCGGCGRDAGALRTRLAAQAAIIEQGAVYIPREAPWLAEFLHELVMFPNAKYRDQVDSTSQALRAWNNPQVKGAAYLAIAMEENAANALAIERNNPTTPDPEGKVWAQGSVEWTAQQQARGLL